MDISSPSITARLSPAGFTDVTPRGRLLARLDHRTLCGVQRGPRPLPAAPARGPWTCLSGGAERQRAGGFSALSLRTEQDSRPLGFAPRRREAQSSVEATAESGRPLVPTLGDDGAGVRASWLLCTPYFRTTPKVHLDIPAQEKGPWQTLARTIYLLGREKCSGRAWRGGRGDRAVPVPHPTGRSPPGMAGVPGVAAPTPALRRPEVSGVLTLSRERYTPGVCRSRVTQAPSQTGGQPRAPN